MRQLPNEYLLQLIQKIKLAMASAELEQQIQTIFHNFDKDKSGTIELSELQAVAKELGEDIPQDQLETIMTKLDANGDGKISLEEFKFWWMEGMKGKLGELVYLKAKALKMTNTFLAQFERAGVNLKEFNTSNKSLDIYDLFIGFGEPEAEGMSVDVNVYLRGDRFKMNWEKLKEKVKWLQQSSINFVLMLPSQDPKKAKEEIESLLKKVMNTNILPFLSEEENPYIGFKLEALQKELVFHIEIKKGLQEVISPPLQKFDDVKSMFDESFYIWWNLTFKTNFTIDDLLEKGNLIECLLRGFQLQLSGEAPNSILKKFREVVEASGRGEGMPIQFLLSILLKNASLRLKLRSPLMVQKFFQKIGIKDILNECPTLSELLQQLSLMPDLQDVKYNVESAGHIIYTALKTFKANFESGIEIFVQRGDSLIHVETAFKNASAIFNIIFNEV